MEEVMGTIFIVIGVIMCVAASVCFYLSYKEQKVKDEKNRLRAIKAAITRKKNQKKKETVIKKTSK